jgi:hypothetical protein
MLILGFGLVLILLGVVMLLNVERSEAINRT